MSTGIEWRLVALYGMFMMPWIFDLIMWMTRFGDCGRDENQIHLGILVLGCIVFGWLFLRTPIRYVEEDIIADHVVRNGDSYEITAGDTSFITDQAIRGAEYDNFSVRLKTRKSVLQFEGESREPVVTLYGPPFSGNETYSGDPDNIVLK